MNEFLLILLIFVVGFAGFTPGDPMTKWGMIFMLVGVVLLGIKSLMSLGMPSGDQPGNSLVTVVNILLVIAFAIGAILMAVGVILSLV